MDEYTGEKLFYSAKGKNASVVQPRHFTTKKTATIDHVVPVDQLKKQYSGNISKEQLKRIANSDFNLAVTAEALNKSKSNMSNHEYLYRQLKNGNPESLTTTYNMIQKEISAKIGISGDIAVTRVSEKVGKMSKVNKKDLKTFTDTVGGKTGSTLNRGTDAGLMTLTISSINNLTLVAAGKKDLDNALKDIGHDAGGSFVSAAGLDLVKGAVSDIAKICKNPKFAKILQKDVPIVQISTIIMVSNSAIRFINDDISGEECLTEILMNGVGAFAYSLGMAVGGPAGAVIGSIVVAQISKSILEYRQCQKLNEEKEQQISCIVSEALVEMEKQRKYLQQIITQKYDRWDNAFDSGFEQIFASAIENDVDGISNGLNTILCIFNERAKFETIQEFNTFFDNADSVLTL
jgi:hypothetical protein